MDSVKRFDNIIGPVVLHDFKLKIPEGYKAIVSFYKRLAQLTGTIALTLDTNRQCFTLLCDTLNDAKLARNILRSEGIKVDNEFIRDIPMTLNGKDFCKTIFYEKGLDVKVVFGIE